MPDAPPAPDDVETELRSFFAAPPPGVAAVYLFGSQARGTARPTSDVDVAVLYRTRPPPTLEGLPLELEGDLERLLGRPVQVIALHTAPVDLVHEVLRDGKLIAEPDRPARIAFEVTARNEYFDLLPVLERYRKIERRRP
jgi:uncharacterized protein